MSDLFSRPVVPVANEADAVETCRAAFPRVAAVGGRPLVVHVVEKAGGAPDKASVEQRELLAEEAFDAVRELAADFGVDVETRVLYGTDVAAAIVDAAADADASAIVFHPRGGWWLLDLLTGDVRDSLVTESDRPVVVLPAVDETDGDDADATDEAGVDS
ncbi:MAG: universal stress protein [Haloplanus sp.]